MLWQPSLPERYLTMPADQLGPAIDARRHELGDKLIILGHHYQTDEVIRHADFTGDSLKLSQLAAERVRERGARYIVFCGVHFMAESADLLAPEGTQVILPDLSAGCSMADMAAYEDAVEAWDSIHESLREQGWSGRVIPITYVNSSAAVKAFVGSHGGSCCTSSNARRVFEWAMAGGDSGSPVRTSQSSKAASRGRKKEDIKVLFLPDQHLGRNTAASMGVNVKTESCVYDPRRAAKGEALGGATPDQLLRSKVILWAGHCSVHKLFRPEHCEQVRAADPTMKILVHPECCKEVVDLADLAGSTEFIIKTIREAPPGSRWAVGTEVHLVNRLAREATDRRVHVRILSDCQCLCTTMYRIDEPHLLWVLDNLAEGKVVNRIRVHDQAREPALASLNTMLALSEKHTPVATIVD
ncbi:MAG TPA: quinolinate synthase [Phycisphaerales bacterium]|nr:quinolinate synthase [Phycisphaerales bacterium]